MAQTGFRTAPQRRGQHTRSEIGFGEKNENTQVDDASWYERDIVLIGNISHSAEKINYFLMQLLEQRDLMKIGFNNNFRFEVVR